MEWARIAYKVLAYLFLIGVAVQFLLAGIGLAELGGEGGTDLDPHREFGFIVLHIIPILMFLAALLGRMWPVPVLLTVLLFVLVFIQPFFTDPELDPRWIRGLHVLNALIIAALGHYLTRFGYLPMARGRDIEPDGRRT